LEKEKTGAKRIIVTIVNDEGQWKKLPSVQKYLFYLILGPSNSYKRKLYLILSYVLLLYKSPLKNCRSNYIKRADRDYEEIK
jgi:hypothetical protein